MHYTPGPWKIVTGNARGSFTKIAIRPNKSIGFGLPPTSPVASVVWYGDLGLANAAIIAAAPDLLEALIALSAAVSGTFVSVEVHNALVQAADTIKKATT